MRLLVLEKSAVSQPKVATCLRAGMHALWAEHAPHDVDACERVGRQWCQPNPPQRSLRLRGSCARPWWQSGLHVAYPNPCANESRRWTIPHSKCKTYFESGCFGVLRLFWSSDWIGIWDFFIRKLRRLMCFYEPLIWDPTDGEKYLFPWLSPIWMGQGSSFLNSATNYSMCNNATKCTFMY